MCQSVVFRLCLRFGCHAHASSTYQGYAICVKDVSVVVLQCFKKYVCVSFKLTRHYFQKIVNARFQHANTFS